MIGNSYLAYVKSSRPTGRALARALGLRNFGIKAPDTPLDVLIRWGSCKNIPNANVVINPSSAIALASDKWETIMKLQQAGIATVPAFRTFAEAKDYAGQGGLIYGRSRRGFGGKDIVVYDPFNYWGDKLPTEPSRHHDWFSTYVNANREVRIHVADGKVIRTQGKYNDNPSQNRVTASGYELIRNYQHGYRFRAPREQLHRNRRDAAIHAIQALGLDFGAVDMLLSSKDSGSILEVNTAPACSPLTARCYAGAIACMVHQKSLGRITLAPELMESELAEDVMEHDNAESYL